MMETEHDHVRSIGDDEHVSESVIRAVAAVSGRSPLALPPLQESVDVDALDLLFASSTAVEGLRFTYAGHDVLVEPTRVHVGRGERQ
ncbi:MAG: HalOD1 output domain-containing protein [Haloplanus sp.]